MDPIACALLAGLGSDPSELGNMSLLLSSLKFELAGAPRLQDNA